MKKIELEKAQVRKKRYTFLSTLIIATTVFLSLLQLILSNHLAGQGKDLALLLRQENTLLWQNERFTREIATNSSIVQVSKRAQELTFIPAVKFLVVAEHASVALAK